MAYSASLAVIRCINQGRRSSSLDSTEEWLQRRIIMVDVDPRKPLGVNFSETNGVIQVKRVDKAGRGQLVEQQDPEQCIRVGDTVVAVGDQPPSLQELKAIEKLHMPLITLVFTRQVKRDRNQLIFRRQYGNSHFSLE